MIVKDEASVIERCLDSVRGVTDYWVICDTGSTDGTQDLIRKLYADKPGELHERPWVDFAHNRSELLELARGKNDYLLLLDADWTFEETDPGALSGLDADAYLVKHQHAGGGGFWHELYNRHLVRGDREWWYVGATHEYIATEGRYTEARLEGAHITNWADGGVGRAARWEQDVQLLVAALERDPSNARDVFYLAQTYRDLGQSDKAIETYRRRAEMGGFEEEVFYSLYQVAALKHATKGFSNAVDAYLRAWDYRPGRLEPLFDLAVGYREQERYQAAFLMMTRAVYRPQPSGDILFVQPWIYRWGALFEYSVSAYWVGSIPQALRACDQLLELDELPDNYREATLRNREFCVQAQKQKVRIRGLPQGPVERASGGSR